MTLHLHIMLTRSKRKVGCNNDDKIIGIKNSNKKLKKINYMN